MRRGESGKFGTGTRHINKDGDAFIVIEYRSWYDVDIKFDCEDMVRNVKAKDIGRKSLVPHTRKSICGVACKGYGSFKTTGVDGKATRAYMLFKLMLERVYLSDIACYPNYGGRGVTVCEEWHNFQNFAEWYYSQKAHDLEGFELDKDLTGSTIYSPSTCFLIPKEINSTLRRVTGKINTELPRGVAYSKSKDRPYLSTFKQTRSGTMESFSTIAEARNHYLINTKLKLLRIAEDNAAFLEDPVIPLLREFRLEDI